MIREHFLQKLNLWPPLLFNRGEVTLTSDLDIPTVRGIEEDFSGLQFVDNKLLWLTVGEKDSWMSLLDLRLNRPNRLPLPGKFINHQKVTAFVLKTVEDPSESRASVIPVHAHIVPDQVTNVQLLQISDHDLKFRWNPVTNINFGGSVVYDTMVKFRSDC